MTTRGSSQKRHIRSRTNQRLLTEFESKEILKQAGIPVVETKLAQSKSEAFALSKELGFPVVLKINSPDVAHKSDAGGVRLGLSSAAQVGEAYSEIMSSIKEKYPKAMIQGISVQKMVSSGVEVIIGMTRDPQFGPVIMFGLGGILVEILKDVSFRIVPVTKREAEEMMKETKGYPLLQGYRGQEPVSIDVLGDLIVRLSQFIERNPQIKELDLNPIFAYKDWAIVVDARIVEDSPEKL